MYREKEVMYTVYQHRNLSNGKSYIGMTSQEPKKRWEYGWGYQNNSQMWSDIKESDWNTDWQHNILGKFEDKQEALNLEEMFIWLFDSTNEGYNTSAYSSHSCKHSKESKRKMSDSMTGNHNSPTKPVLQFSKNGELIAEYPSEMEACKHTGCDNSSISKCCKGEYKSTGGFIWRYKKS